MESCPVGIVLATLPATDEAHELVAGRFKDSTIAICLRVRGFMQVTPQAVSAHKKGRCGCEDPVTGH